MLDEKDKTFVLRSACNRAVNSYFNTLLGYMASQMYVAFDNVKREDMEKFLAQLEKDVVEETFRLVSTGRSVADDDLKNVLVSCVSEMSTPLNKFINNVKESKK